MAAHRYWRISVLSNGNTPAPGNAVGIAEIAMAEAGGPNKIGTGTASASSVFPGGYAAANAFDGNPSTLWSSDTSNLPAWIAYDFGAGNAWNINNVTITGRNDNYFQSGPATFTIDYSDDAAAWTASRVFTAAPWSSGQIQAFAIDQAALYLLKINAYAVLTSRALRTGKINSYVVLPQADLRIGKVVSYAVLLPAPPPVTAAGIFVVS
jgi:hypothetical protein